MPGRGTLAAQIIITTGTSPKALSLTIGRA